MVKIRAKSGDFSMETTQEPCLLGGLGGLSWAASMPWMSLLSCGWYTEEAIPRGETRMSDEFRYIYQFEPGKGPGSDFTLLLLHGTGGDEHALDGLGRALLPGANRLSPRGNVLENGMPRFFRRFAEGLLDVEDLKQ